MPKMTPEEAHNKGQEDAAKGPGNYKPPGQSMDGLGLFDDDQVEARESYKEGYSHGEKQRSSGGCFLTTACVEHAGLADDCHELTVLRSFRSNYVARLVDGSSVLAEYRKVAPTIVERIKHDTNRETILTGIYATVTQAVELVESGKHAEAFSCYEAMFNGLRHRYQINT